MSFPWPQGQPLSANVNELCHRLRETVPVLRTMAEELPGLLESVRGDAGTNREALAGFVARLEAAVGRIEAAQEASHGDVDRLCGQIEALVPVLGALARALEAGGSGLPGVAGEPGSDPAPGGEPGG